MLKQRLLTGWNLMRVIRLAVGIWIMIVAAQTHNWAISAIGSIFVIMALTNTGCRGVNGCALPHKPGGQNVNEETVQKNEEIK